jgi:hypothetical protein
MDMVWMALDALYMDIEIVDTVSFGCETLWCYFA